MFLDFLKKWSFLIIFAIFAFVFSFTGAILDTKPPIQDLFIRLSLLCYWYLFIYIVRRFRIGKIEWNEEDKKIYYFILLVCSALIFAFG